MLSAASFSHYAKPWLTALEFPRALHELSLLAPAHPWLKKLPRGDGHPIIVIPGFCANNASTVILRHYLAHWGYAVEPWSLGTNINALEINNFDDILDFKERAVATVCKRLDEIYTETGEQTSLIGWSLGGVFSRAIASQAQSRVKQVITLGSPFGDPRTVIIYALLKKLKKQAMTDKHLEAWFDMCNAPLGRVAISNFYSRSDGIVPTHIAHNINHHLQETVHVFSSHVGFAVNPMVLYLIAKRLQPQCDTWKAMQSEHALEKLLFSMSAKVLVKH